MGDAKMAGELQKFEMNQDGSLLVLKPLGTDNEGILRACTAKPLEPFKCHLCPRGCTRQPAGDYLIHGLKGRKMRAPEDEGWVTNLCPEEAVVEVEDENAGLRARAKQLQQGEVGQPVAPPEGLAPSPERGRGQDDGIRTKKKKKKKRSKEEQKIFG